MTTSTAPRRARFALSVLLLAAAAASGEPAAVPPNGFGWLAALAGSCWVGSDAQGRTTDRQCYEFQYGHFLRGAITVHAGSATGKGAYLGDSFFAWDAQRERIIYTYWASAGHHGRAGAQYEGERLVFPPTHEAEVGDPQIRSIWERLDAGSFVVVREQRDGDGWVELMRATYRRERAPGTAPAGSPLAPLAWLADACWTGTFADGKTLDLVCYDWMLGGKFLRSRHRVIGGAGPYSGETIWARHPTTQKLEFTYFNSLGGILPGEVEPFVEGLRFPSEKAEMGGESFELRSVWRRRGDDRYVAVTERLESGDWRPFMSIDFVRSGPASDWSEE